MKSMKHVGLASAVAFAAAVATSAGGCTGGGGGGGGFTAAGSTATPSTSTGPSVTPPTTPAGPAARTKTAQVVARHGEGFLEVDHGGKKILHVKGTSYERGVQYGALVGDEIEGVLGQLPVYAAQQGGNLAAYAQALITPAGSLIFRPYFDQDARDELRGILDGLRIRNPGTWVQEQDLIFINSIIDLGAVVDLSVFRCSSMAVWGNLSKDGKAYQTRCVDLMVGSGLENHTLVVIEKPDGGVPYLNPGWAGLIGCPSGLNAHGIGVGQVWAFSTDKGFGRPWVLSTRELMATGDECDDGYAIFQRDQRTYGSNFVFCDRGDTRGGQPRAIAIEYSKSHLVKFESNDPKEDLALWNGQNYAIRIADACFRGDSYMDPLMRSLQTASSGPTGDPRTASAYRNRYKGQADEIQRFASAGTKIGAQELIEATRTVAMRRNSLQCVVYENTDLEVWVANARIDASGAMYDAWQEPYHHYSLDYYTPTATCVPDKTQAALGGAVRAAVALETLGRGRLVEVRLALELAGTRYPLVTTGTATTVLPERGRATVTLDGTLPASLPNVGIGVLVAEVYEAGTNDLVDVSTATFTVTP